TAGGRGTEFKESATAELIFPRNWHVETPCRAFATRHLEKPLPELSRAAQVSYRISPEEGQADLRGTVGPLPGVVIARNGLVEQVGDALRELIIDQALAPGERLNITALARQLGVSDTPVREALG